MLAALILALLIALGLGAVAYALTSPEILSHMSNGRNGAMPAEAIPSAEFIFFSIFSFFYLMWATLPLSIGASRQSNQCLLMYPISLRNLSLSTWQEKVTCKSILRFRDPGIGWVQFVKVNARWALLVAV